MTEEISHTFKTLTGQRIDLTRPDPSAIHFSDICDSLSKTCRFGGHVFSFYSVAQHSVLVLDLVEQKHIDVRRASLVHDFAEAYVGDVIGPLKTCDGMERYRTLERAWESVIRERFGVKWDSSIAEEVKAADAEALTIEMLNLTSSRPSTESMSDHAKKFLASEIVPLDSRAAADLLVSRMRELFGSEAIYL